MRNINLFLAWLTISLSATAVFGQQHSWIQIGNSTKTESEIKLVSSSNNETVISFNLNAYELKKISTNNGKAIIVDAPNSAKILKSGAPDLPCFATSVIIPDFDEMTVEIINSNFIEINNINIAPSKGNLLRIVDPTTIPYTFGTEYQKNAFYPSDISYLREPFIFRDYRGQSVVIQPFLYNPVTKVLRIYTELKLIVKSKGIPGVNTFLRTKALTTIDREFNSLYNSKFLNYTSTAKYTQLSDLPGKMLIISDPSFMAAIQPFVNWKILEGIPCEMISVATAGGTNTAIKNYVTNYYNTNGLTYLLLVGDAAQIPTFTSAGGGSDPSYGYIVGTDKYQEIFVGRFSAETVTHVTTQVTRTIQYEKYPTLTPGKFNHCVGIGSNDPGTGHFGEFDWQHQRNILTNLMGYTYTSEAELFDGDKGGLDAAGDVTPAQLTTEINNGTGIITYTGHGGDNVFVTSNFSNTDCVNLTNTTMWPFVWSVACVNGNFTAGTCLAEAMLRSTKNDLPTGAVATLMSTINQSWIPPMYAQEEMVDVLRESVVGNIKRTFGGLSVNGIFKMNEVSPDPTMTDTWTIFGDPSLMVRTTDPIAMTVSHQPTLIIGLNTLQVNCDVEGAFVAITNNNQIYGTGYVTGGIANITVNPAPTTVGQIFNVCATAYNYVPYIGTFEVASSGTPYIVYDSKTIHDSGIAANGNVEYSENVNLDVTLKNVGTVDATNITATLTSTSTNISITDNSQTYGNITSNTTSLQNNAFAFTVNNVITDQQSTPFTITSSDGGSNTWQTNFSLVLNAPVMEATTVIIDDAITGNNNGRLDPGETASIKILTFNNGHAISPTSNTTLTINSGSATLPSNSQNIGIIPANGNTQAIYTINVDAGATTGSTISLTYNVNAGGYTTTKSFTLTIGLIVEDFESNTFSEYPWNMTQIGNAPWTIINSGSIYEGNYTARSGIIPNGTYTVESTSELTMSVNVLSNDSMSFYKKVSSESGYDFLTFYVDGVQKGRWSGEVNWSREAYYITTGTHIIKWIYSKDYMEVGGQDAAWVDFIIFPPINIPLAITESNNNLQYLSSYPNPFESESTIVFSLLKTDEISISILNTLGETVKSVLPKQTVKQGEHKIQLSGEDLASGIYFCKMQTSSETKIVKIVVSK
jgi:hypothetical protein